MRPFAARDLLALRTFGQAAIAPDGRWAALVERAIDPERDRNTTRLMRWALDAPERPPISLTRGPDDDRPAFSPDGASLAFLAKRDDPYRQLYRLPLDGGDGVRLTDVDGGVKDFRWLPDGKGLVLTCALEEDRILPARDPQAPEEDLFTRYTRDVKVVDRTLYKIDGEGFLGRRRNAVCLLDLESGALRLLLGGPYDHTLAFVERSGEATVVIANRGPDPDRELPLRDLWRVPHDGSAARRLTDLHLGIAQALATADGSVYVLAPIPEHVGYGSDHLFRLAADGSQAADLTPDLPGLFGDATVGDVPASAGDTLLEGPDGRPWGLWSASGRVSVVRLGADDRPVEVCGGDRAITAAAPLGDGRLVVCATDPTHPGYVALEADGRVLARHEATPDWADIEVGLSRPEHISAQAEGGPVLDAWYLPPASARQRGPDGRVPAILEIHGGPAGMYGYRFFAEFQLLAAAGYGVVYDNPRGSTGYGDAFSRDILADWGNHDYLDVMAGIDAAVAAHPDIDPRRLGVAGGSYGGFMVNWIVGHTDCFAAAVTMRSVVNRMSAMGTSDMGYLRIRQFEGSLWWEDIEPYLHQSPLMWVSNIRTPLLIEHQEGDLRCPIDQAEQLYMALRVLGREVRFVRYPGESHGMSRTGRPWHRVHRLITIQAWFDDHLSAAAEAGGSK